MRLLIMSVPCIFTPFIKRGGEVAGERQRKTEGERRKSGRVTVRSRDKQREGK